MSEFVFAERIERLLEFVGDFDGLYRAEPDPWGQSAWDGETANYYDNSRGWLAEALSYNRCMARRGLEIGCGHGHLTNRLSRRLHAHVVGADISEVAIEKARSLYPDIPFVIHDVTGEPWGVEPFDFVILAQCLWYLLHDIDRALANALSYLKPGGLLVMSQGFLKGEQRYGREIADGFQGTLRMFLTRCPELALIEARFDDSNRLSLNDGLLIFRKPYAHPGDSGESAPESGMG